MSFTAFSRGARLRERLRRGLRYAPNGSDSEKTFTGVIFLMRFFQVVQGQPDIGLRGGEFAVAEHLLDVADVGVVPDQ